MDVKPLRENLQKFLKRHNLQNKFNKQLSLFKDNPRYPSLHTERLEPKALKIYSFRVNRKYRAIFILISPREAEIVDINSHIQVSFYWNMS